MKTYSVSFIKYFSGIVAMNFFCCYFLILNPVNISAQVNTTRPGVGLVLSGGGAHGIAHIGVIKVMEEAGLRPDYITGVSMGSIIGGMYSLGYTADSVQKILKMINWKLVMSNNISENKVIFLEKNNFNNCIISLPLSSRKVVLPSGLINGQQVENTLNFYTWPAADINDFSKLPIPFQCTATDIITYKKVDLATGYLPDAIRASFSVPSVFTPLKIDTLLLLDGGLIRNFPAREIKEMGADIVVGSYTGFRGYKEDGLQSVSGIMKQIAFFRSLKDFEEQKILVDVLVIPETDEFSFFGFENIDSIVRKGYEAALPYKNYFKNLADSLNLIGPQKPIKNILDKQFYTFDKIEIAGNKIYSDFQILGVLNIKPEEKIDKYQLSDRIELLYGKIWFDKVKYRIVPRNDSLVLVIDCIEKPQAMFYASAYYNNSLQSGLVLGLSVKDLFTPRSVININSYISQFYRIKLNAIQFIDRNQIFGMSANLYADNTFIPMLEMRGETGNVISRNFTPGLSINRRLGLNHMMSVSLNYENLDLVLRYDADSRLKNLSYNYISETYDYQANSLDSKHFPGKGTIINISAGTSKLLSGILRTDSSKTVFKGDNPGEFSFDRFYTLFGSFKQYFTATEKLTFAFGADALFITDSDSVSAQNNFFLLGGFESLNKRSVPLIGFHPNEIPVKKMAGIRGELDIEMIQDFHLTLTANIFAVREVNRSKGYSILSGYGLGVGYMSIFGPMRIGLMQGFYNKEDFFRQVKGYIGFGYSF
jgi:NTE family protein